MKKIIAGLSSLLVVLALGFPTTVQADPVDPVGDCVVPGLERADVWISDYEADGRAQPKVPAGVAVPVLLVHGWTGNSLHINDPLGNFSKKVDLTTHNVDASPSTRTVVGMLQYLNGTDVHTFDYSEVSGDWVTNDRIHASLAESIACLADASGQKVIVVAHSMGGLAMRQAFASSAGLEERVSQVITFGTPNTGSDLARLVAGGLAIPYLPLGVLDAARLLTRLALQDCGARSTVNIATGTICDILIPPVRAFDSGAGRALRTGSTELAELPMWPAGIPVHALAGETTLTIPKSGFLGWTRTQDVPMGDVIVPSSSATAGSTTQDYAKCRYTLSPVHSIGETLLVHGLKIVSYDEAGRNLLDFGNSPCFHSSLMRTFTLVNAMQDYVNEDLLSRWTIEPGRIGPWAAGVSLEDATALYGESVGIMPGPTEFACESVPARLYPDGSGVDFVWRAWNGDYASLLYLKDPVGVSAGTGSDVYSLQTRNGIGLGSSKAELDSAYGTDLVKDGRAYSPNDFSVKYATSDGNIHFYGTDGRVSGISVSAPGGQSLDHFCT